MVSDIYRSGRDKCQRGLLTKYSQHILAQQSILDVGCGSGWISTLIAPTTEYLGIDLNTEGINAAIERYTAPNRTFMVADLYTFVPNHIYDMTIAVGMYGGLGGDLGNIKKLLLNMVKWSDKYATLVELDQSIITIIDNILKLDSEFKACDYDIIRTLKTQQGYICCLEINKGGD